MIFSDEFGRLNVQNDERFFMDSFWQLSTKKSTQK